MWAMREQHRKAVEVPKAAFSGMAAITFKILLDDEKFSEDRIAFYNQRLHEYYEAIEEYGEEYIQLITDKYNSEFDNEKDKATYREEVVTIKRTKNPYWMFQKQEALLGNKITQEFDKFMLVHLNTLLDMNISKKRIQMNRKKVVDFIENEIDHIDFNVFVKQLEEDYGVVIEIPQSTIKNVSFAVKGEYMK